MATQDLGRISELEVREVWRYEAQNFTVWLSEPENLDLLGTSLGLELEFVGREISVGPYWLDILAQERGSGRYVAIENQLEWTDHGHLGQLLTYAAGRLAQILIWVAPRFTDQHRDAINWLNQWTQRDIECYAVEVHVVQIDDSRPAAEFVPVAVPRNWTASNPRLTIPSRPSLADSQWYREFFQPLIDELREMGFTDKTEAKSEYYQEFSSSLTDEFTYQVSMEDDGAWVYLQCWASSSALLN